MAGTDLTTAATGLVRAVAARDLDTQASILQAIHGADFATLAAFSANLAHLVMHAAEGRDLQAVLDAVDAVVATA